jgi:threonylcarbamoyladenosine tRNA methylthiotransferase MtaB
MIDNSLFHNKKVAYHTLGCKLNFAETSSIAKQLSEEGFVKVRAGEEADICIVNTCSVTDTADHKCRQAIKRLQRQHPNALIIVTGCYAQLKPEEVSAIEGVDLVLGANEKFDLLEYLRKMKTTDEIFSFGFISHSDILKTKEFKPACSRDGRTRFFLKVQDGCDYYCTYCTIPLARGHSRNASIAETVKMAQQAIAEGAKEIVLSGVNTGDFGKTTSEKFIDLVKALDNLPDAVRFRISSVEPNLLTDELIEFIAASKRFMPHFHIPLQAGSNEVLQLMKRRYTTEFFAEKIKTIRRVLPDAFVGVDVIVGVRGETAELFEKSVHFIESLDISQLHVFTYSERAGTKMLEITDQIVPLAERKKRSEILHDISDKKTKAFYEKQIGKPAHALWESRKNTESMVGFTENYIRVEAPLNKEHINTVQIVQLGDWNEDKTALKIDFRLTI